MAHGKSESFYTLRYCNTAKENDSSDDSDIDFVSGSTCRELQFNPVTVEDAQLLCTRLKVQCKKRSLSHTASGVLGAPCKNVKIKGDGNCFFRAVSEALCGTEEYHEPIRNAVVQQLQSKQHMYRTILRVCYRSVSEYITESNMNCLGSWATEVEIQAAADMLGVSIYTYYTNRWIEYRSNGLEVSKQGIYLENSRNHYETVVCVKRPQTQSCYGYCQGYEIGNSHIPQAVRSSGSKSSDSESSSGADMAGDYEDWMCDDYQDNCQEDYTHNRDTPGADMEDTRDQEAETSPRSTDSLVDYDIYDSEESDYEVHTQDVDSEQLYSEQVDDEEVVYCEEVYGEEVDTGAVVECEEVDDDEVVDCDDVYDEEVYDDEVVDCEDVYDEEVDDGEVVDSNEDYSEEGGELQVYCEDGHDSIPAVEDSRKQHSMESMLSWSILNTSWHSFLEWLGERWWGSVSKEQIITFMDTSNSRKGDIVVAAHFGGMQGGVCSIMVKTQDSVMTFTVVISRGRYICTDMVQGLFSTPIDIMKVLVRKLGEGHLLRRPRWMAHNPKYFAMTQIVDELRYIVKLIKGSWWGAAFLSLEMSPPHGKVIELLRMRTNKHTNPAAAIHYMNEDSLGYLFDIVTAKGKRFKVTFDNLGFTIGTGVHFPYITSILSRICCLEDATFVARPKNHIFGDEGLERHPGVTDARHNV
jgi:hypothetical protein